MTDDQIGEGALAQALDIERLLEHDRAARGVELRAYREKLGLSQASLASRIGTTQQTVDRLERGQVAHSRFFELAVAGLNAFAQEARFMETLSGEASRRLEREQRFDAPLLRLEPDGELSHLDRALRLHFEPSGDRAEAYGLMLTTHILGRNRDVIFRAHDMIVAAPKERAKHQDWVVATETVEGVLRARVVQVIDPVALITPMTPMEAAENGYILLDPQSRQQHRIVGWYTI